MKNTAATRPPPEAGASTLPAADVAVDEPLLDGHALTKLEVLGDERTLFPDVVQTLEAAEARLANAESQVSAAEVALAAGDEARRHCLQRIAACAAGNICDARKCILRSVAQVYNFHGLLCFTYFP